MSSSFLVKKRNFTLENKSIVTPEGSPSFGSTTEIQRCSEDESAPVYQERDIQEANVFLRLSPILRIGDPRILLQGRPDLRLDIITTDYGVEYAIAHKGLRIREKFKKTEQSPTWYHGQSIVTEGACVYLQEVNSPEESMPHSHHEHDESLDTLDGVCNVRVGEIEYASDHNHPVIKFPTYVRHSVRAEGLYAINLLVITGPGDCSSMEDHHR